MYIFLDKEQVSTPTYNIIFHEPESRQFGNDFPNTKNMFPVRETVRST